MTSSEVNWLQYSIIKSIGSLVIFLAKLLEGQSDPSGNTTALLTGDASVAAVASGGKSVLFETLVHITAYLELLDSFETAKRMFAQQDRNDRQAEYPKGIFFLFYIRVEDHVQFTTEN